MKYFSINELCRSNIASRYSIDNTPSEEIKSNLKILIEKLLDPIRELWKGPLIVSSGYRCPKLNKLVKGSSTSNHLKGYAADLYPKNNTLDERKKLFNMIKYSGLEFDELLYESGCIHVAYRLNNNRKKILDLSWKY